jgi:benzoate membrane transport protein
MIDTPKSKEKLFAGWTLQGGVNGCIAWLFGVTGPLLIVLKSAEVGGLSEDITISWIFSIYVIGGLSTIGLSLYYKQPIAVAFSIPGAVLVGTTLMNHTFTDVLGAYLVTGLLLLLISITKTTNLFMNAIPLPIMMGMVSGVLLPFGLNIFKSVLDLPMINGAALIVFLLLTVATRVGKYVPPLLGAILIAFIFLFFDRSIAIHSFSMELSKPLLLIPTFNLSTMGELVIPLLVTVIAIQNAQGITILNSLGYKAPVEALTRWSGIGSVVNSFLGAHSACIAGPMTGIIADKSSGKQLHRYKSALVMGILWVFFGLFAGLVIEIVQEIPISLIELLAGLALLFVLKNCLVMSFSANFQMGTLFSFMITLSGFSLLNIGSPFWGLVFGTILSFIFEKDDFKKTKEG